MNMETYEQTFRKERLYEELAISEKQLEEGKTKDAKKALSDIRIKYMLEKYTVKI